MLCHLCLCCWWRENRKWSLGDWNEAARTLNAHKLAITMLYLISQSLHMCRLCKHGQGKELSITCAFWGFLGSCSQ